jgi:NADH-quinone oxidoreductase subunit E
MAIASAGLSEKDLQLGQIQEICKAHEGRKGDLLIVLQKIQAVLGYFPQWAIEMVADSLGVTTSEIFGVLTFYNRFHLTPRGKHTIRCCRGTACHFKGSADIIEAVRNHLKLGDGDTTEDSFYSLEEVACLGACGIAPVMTIDEDTFGNLTEKEAIGAIDRHRAKSSGNTDSSG